MHCLSDAIAAAGKFSGYRSPHIRARLVHSAAALSDSEWRVLAMMVAGASPGSIANVTRRSYKTISSHKLNIMRKLGLNQAGFMAYSFPENPIPFLTQGEKPPFLYSGRSGLAAAPA